MRCWLWCAMCAALVACDTAPGRVDLIIRNGDVYDGLALEPRRVDVAVTGDRIIAVGDLGERTASTEIDASGLAVAPGFIDVQSRAGTTLLTDGTLERHVRQGITTAVIADARSPAFWNSGTAEIAALKPFDVTFDWTGLKGYFARLAQRGTTLNVAVFMPLSLTPPGEETLRAAMASGALGLLMVHDGTALPGGSEAVGGLARVLAAERGVLAMQFSGSDSSYERALTETLAIAEAARVPLVVYDPLIDDPMVLRNVQTRIRAARTSVLTTMVPVTERSARAEAWWVRNFVSAIGTASDGGSRDDSFGRGEPARADDVMSLVLARYVREERVISLGDAIRRMTGWAAAGLGIEHRGFIREGQVADVVVFDPSAVAPSTPDTVHGYSVGIHHVIVNGVPVLDRRGLTGARPGRAVYGRRYQPTQPLQ